MASLAKGIVFEEAKIAVLVARLETWLALTSLPRVGRCDSDTSEAASDIASDYASEVALLQQINPTSPTTALSEGKILAGKIGGPIGILGIVLAGAIAATVGSGGGGGGTITIPPVSTAAPTTTVSAPTGTPAPYIVGCTDKIQLSDFSELIAQIIAGGGSVTEEFVVDAASFYYMTAELFPRQISELDQDIRVAAISIINQVAEFSSFDMPPNIGSMPSLDPKKSQSKVLLAKEFRPEPRTNLTKRILPTDATADDCSIDGVTQFTSVPFHLHWLSRLFFKTELQGNFFDVPYYYWDSSVPATRVYVLDSGADTNHPDLAGRINEGLNFGTDPEEPLVDFGDHGTSMASLVGGKMTGVHKNADLHVYGMADNNGVVRIIVVLRALARLLTVQRPTPASIPPLAVVQIAWSFPYPPPVKEGQITRFDALQGAMQIQQKNGCILVLASGNTPTDTLDLNTPGLFLSDPANPAIVVGSVDASGVRSSFTTYLTSPAPPPAPKLALDIYTIGEGILSAKAGTQDYRYHAGTSPASAITSGLIAYMIGEGTITSVDLAKEQLVAAATARKGLNWDLDPGYSSRIPRSATDWEVSCTAGERTSDGKLISPGTPIGYSGETPAPSTQKLDISCTPNNDFFNDGLAACITLVQGPPQPPDLVSFNTI